ncbi:hypothetical protein MSSAC_3026 [Methanosarcina siciliae C2J]|uniref:Uncharacterized protein n=1 Tax=Methanosarcina siciliae C2J TaxID=1434118 RepID=A0A0E3LDP2_9EURY|nr:hypothetical protein [Methanosarcina siciliae]AKB37616.1 hypothetical protein MSSAC_3026 [Methanosarcina siciliae C2J]
MKKALKIFTYTFLIISLLVFITGLLIVSFPIFLNTYAHLLFKWSGSESNNFDYQVYSKEEFAAKHFNTSLTPQDNFISLFKAHYGAKNSDIRVVTFSKLKNPNNNSISTFYGIISQNDSSSLNSSSLMFQGEINDSKIFNLRTYSNEEFASDYNTSLTSQEDLISLYENYYGLEDSDITFVVYDILHPQDRSIHTFYGIFQNQDCIFTITWKENQIVGNNSRLLKDDQSASIISQRSPK